MPGKAIRQPVSWHSLTSYLSKIKNSGESVAMAPGVSLEDLLVGVDHTKYYCYLGSLMTPNGSESVVWTVFKDSVRDLIDLFSTTVHFSDSSSPFMTNIYRSIQPPQEVATQPASSSAASATYYSLGLTALSLALEGNYTQ